MERYSKDNTFLSEQKLKALAVKTPTPFYLYHEAGIGERLQQLHRAFSTIAPHRQFFPLRCCSNRALVNLLHQYGCGVTCDSRYLVELARECGFSDADILYTGLTPAEGGCTPVVDGLHAMPLSPSQTVVLRIDPNWIARPKEAARRDSDRYRIGMSKEELFQLIPHLLQFGVSNIGLSLHDQGSSSDPKQYVAAAKILFTVAAEIKSKLDVDIISCCLGNGLGISRDPSVEEPDLESIVKEIGGLYRNILIPVGLGGMSIHTALGQWVLLRQGIFVTKVTSVKPRIRPMIIVDAAYSQFPEQGKSYHRHVSMVGNSTVSGRVTYSLSSCQPDAPLFFDSCILPPVEPGNYLFFHSAGGIRADSRPGQGYPDADEYMLHPDGSVSKK